MKEDGGFPACGNTATKLGVRPKVDIKIDEDRNVLPGTGGMSVSPSPEQLPEHRRPEALGGKSKYPAWEIKVQDLGPELKYRPDPKNSDHGFVEPARQMDFAEYQNALEETRQKWKKVG
ncbi:hypothetical protein [Gloeobacter kilaueensis]|uniref:Uncharacterized protein n=1 Tax=Gloeobacter kilaueensis (strain ATCC BAA-2537 / CCAP 1431/1 / ULC 316 / JS1) TaxID=1183438 RepID=U5QNJ3_GLOK1|nr:hypothetical protein [Gloeobacter kilaueensis]AGY60438.1 hypothetical protein GKIL_4192 [Gloeobacter kilaueensis JS1]